VLPCALCAQVWEVVELFAQALDLSMDSAECRPAEGQPQYTAPCLALEQGFNNTVVVANSSLPASDALTLRDTVVGGARSNSTGSEGTLYLPYIIQSW